MHGGLLRNRNPAGQMNPKEALTSVTSTRTFQGATARRWSIRRCTSRRGSASGAIRMLTFAAARGIRIFAAALIEGASIPITVMEGFDHRRAPSGPVPTRSTPESSPALSR